jgi:hypothetical protein
MYTLFKLQKKENRRPELYMKKFQITHLAQNIKQQRLLREGMAQTL